MARKGWILLWHKMAENPLWLEETFTKGQAWIDLLLMASTQETEQPGAVCCSRMYLARRWRWSHHKVTRFLDRLERDGMVFVNKNGKLNGKPDGKCQNVLLTIVKYGSYQVHKRQNGKPDGKQDGNQNGTENGDIERRTEEAARRAGAVGTGDRKLPDVIRGAGFESWDEYNEWRRRNT